MQRWIQITNRLMVSTLWSMALLGLVFPQQIFGQSSLRLSTLAGLKAESHMEISLLEMQADDTMPSRFRLDFLDRSLIFEFEDAKETTGYHWYDEADKRISGFQALPDLQDVLSWQVERDAAGFFQATIPARQLGQAEDAEDRGAALERTVNRPKVEVYGLFDQKSRSFDLTALIEEVGAMDITISLDQLPKGTFISDAVGSESKGVVIVVPIAAALALLGLVLLSCGTMFVWGALVCRLTCAPAGVQSTSFSCVPVQSYTCTCHDFGGGTDGCNAGSAPIVALSLDGSAKTAFSGSGIQLDRLEESGLSHDGEAVSYLMAEWALVRHTADGESEIVRASSDRLDQGKTGRLIEGLVAAAASKGAEGPQTTLLLAVPPHAENSREITLPQLNFTAASGGQAGRVLVRADFSEDRRLQELTVLADTLGGVSADLIGEISAGLTLRFEDDQQHRTIAFAVLSLGDNARVESVETYLPKCCCGAEFCL